MVLKRKKTNPAITYSYNSNNSFQKLIEKLFSDKFNNPYCQSLSNEIELSGKGQSVIIQLCAEQEDKNVCTE